ncbi:hypothetical protein [Vibrio diazotrophicus]|uniref:hypothetical protein n=1 Tax=Vibrio diazotrophicus TaxID=685 RepID=UPI00142E0DB8|nr:hypothetical protein [Vibrio diazotrophicus]NIY91410.1 hypothetical protein [Vibrio diazotrophicus]
MTLLSKKRQLGGFIGLVVLIGSVYWGAHSASNTPPQTYIRLSGIKPADSTIKAWANYIASGDDCESYSYDMFGQKAHQGGKITTFFTQNFAEDDDHYELRIPYNTYTDTQNCIVELRDITVEAYNAFDSVGFAQLRIYQAGDRYNNKPIDLSSKIEAKDCNSHLYQWSKGVWKGVIGCYYFTNDKKLSKESETNAEKVYFDFSQFNDDTIIHYDIIAGKNYRIEALDPQTGK